MVSSIKSLIISLNKVIKCFKKVKEVLVKGGADSVKKTINFWNP